MPTFHLQVHYPSILHSARGIGTYCAIGAKDASTRDTLVILLRQKGKRGNEWLLAKVMQHIC